MYLVIAFFCLFTIKIFSKKFLDVGNYHPIITRKIIMKIMLTILKPIFFFEIIINPIFFFRNNYQSQFLFRNNYQSLSSKKCHLLTTLQKSEHRKTTHLKKCLNTPQSRKFSTSPAPRKC